jgi:prepilin-type N-terminal cleavage/methylation domain-containing protein
MNINNLNHKGFSLTELMIAMGLLGGISLVTMKLVEEQKNNEAYIRARGEISKTLSQLKSSLNNPEVCRYILAGKTLNALGVPLPYIRVPMFRSGGQITGHIRENVINNAATDYVEYFKPATKYVGFETLPNAGVTGSFVLIQPAGSQTGHAQINFNFLVKSKTMKLWSSGTNVRTISETLPVTVSTSGTTVTDCKPAVTATNLAAQKKACLSLKSVATWDTATNKCKYNSAAVTIDCKSGKVLNQIYPDGTVECVDLLTKIDLNYIFQDSRINPATDRCTVLPNTSGGKFRIIKNAANKLQIQCN